jgi:hypothetical protein
LKNGNNPTKQWKLKNPALRHSVLIFVLVIVFVFLLSTFCDSQQKTSRQCSGCGKKTTGEVYIYESGPIFCAACYNNMAKCTWCKMPAKKLIPLDGQQVCSDCSAKVPNCSICKKPAVKHFIRTENEKSQVICEPCLRKESGNCGLCSKSLHGESITIVRNSFGYEYRYCSRCMETSRNCYACGALVEGGAKLFPGNRPICKYCRTQGLRTEAEYRKILQEVDQFFRTKLGLRCNFNHSFKVVNLAVLLEKRKKKESMEPGEPTSPVGLYIPIRKTSVIYGDVFTQAAPGEIYILDYLPKEIAYTVVAHEYAHAWYYERVFVTKSRLFVEGFAEWAAYQMVIQKKLNAVAEGMLTRTCVYGQGLKMMLEYEKKHGRKALLDFVIREKE